MHLRPSLIKFLFFQKSALRLPSALLPKGKTTTPKIPILGKVANLMSDVNLSSVLY